MPRPCRIKFKPSLYDPECDEFNTLRRTDPGMRRAYHKRIYEALSLLTSADRSRLFQLSHSAGLSRHALCAATTTMLRILAMTSHPLGRIRRVRAALFRCGSGRGSVCGSGRGSV